MSNEITKYDDIIDSRDVIARIEELQENVVNYTAGWNMTGCLADGGPDGFVSFDDAKQHILDTLQREADSIENESAAEEIESIIQDINLESGEFSYLVKPLNYWYWVSEADGEPEDEEEAAELKALVELAEQCEGYGDWQYGEALIRDTYFVEYAQDLAEEIGAIGRNLNWPYTCIDWEQAARELQMDYTPVDFDGITYWMRS